MVSGRAPLCARTIPFPRRPNSMIAYPSMYSHAHRPPLTKRLFLPFVIIASVMLLLLGGLLPSAAGAATSIITKPGSVVTVPLASSAPVDVHFGKDGRVEHAFILD